MKKIFIGLMALVMVLAFVSCESDDTNSSSTSSDEYISLDTSNIPQPVSVEEYAAKGELYNLPYKLGTDPAVITEAYKDITISFVEEAPDASESEESPASVATIPENSFEVRENDDKNMLTYATIQGESAYYCYKDGEESLGISFIGYMGNAYNFSSNISNQDDIIAACGQPAAITAATADDIFYMRIKPENLEKMTYTYGQYQVDFLTLDKILISTNIRDLNVWK